MYLGVQAVIAKSFARIHRANLVNFGIVPLEASPEVYDALRQGDELVIEGAREALQQGQPLRVQNVTHGGESEVRASLTARQTAIVLAGGMLSYIKQTN